MSFKTPATVNCAKASFSRKSNVIASYYSRKHYFTGQSFDELIHMDILNFHDNSVQYVVPHI